MGHIIWPISDRLYDITDICYVLLMCMNQNQVSQFQISELLTNFIIRSVIPYEVYLLEPGFISVLLHWLKSSLDVLLNFIRTRIIDIECRRAMGYIDVGDKMCWWLLWDVDDPFNTTYWFCHQHLKSVNIIKSLT